LLRVEPLEERALLSSSGIAAPAATATVPPMVVLRNHSVVVGTLKGPYTTQDRIPDVGRSWKLHATGALAGIGRSTIEGTLHGTGFIIRGRAGGTLNVTTSRGTMTITLLGPLQRGFSGLPNQLTYHVTKATGSDRFELGATGRVTLTLLPHHPDDPNSPGTIVLAFSTN
jgi:hypothetical protein